MRKIILFIIYFFEVFTKIIKLNFFTIPHSYSDNITSNINTLYDSNIFTKISIGTPKKIIDSKIIFTSFSYYIVENEKNNQFYSNKTSNSFSFKLKNKLSFYNSNYKFGYICSENFYFINDTNLELIVEKFPIIYVIESNLKYPSYLGFNYRSTSEDYEINFIERLKSDNYIDSSIFTFEFFNDTNGEIIIGNLPHIYNPEKYNKDELRWSNLYISYPNFVWNLFFNKITFNNVKFIGSTICNIDYESNLIFAPIEYKKLVLQKFINKNGDKCEEVRNEKKHSFFICDKSVNIKSIPKISFVSNELNFDFEVDYKDLFKEINGKLYFLVAFEDTREFKRWKLGTPFLKKYKFIYAQSNKLIGFYVKTSNDNNFFGKIIWLFILLFIIIILIYIIIKIRVIKRKKRLNEVEDIYQYVSN